MENTEKEFIFQLGNDQITPKATYYPSEIQKRGFHTFYFSEDRSGLSNDTIIAENLDAEIAQKNIFLRWAKLLGHFLKKKPKNIELYLSQRPWHLLYYYFLARIFNAKVIIWCRGELRNYFTHNPLRRAANKFLLLNADFVLLRELYMEDVLTKAGIFKPSKTIFFPNSIPIQDLFFQKNKNKNKVLFLNSFKSFRNLELVIEAAEIIHKKYPEIGFDLVGSTLNNKGYSPSKEDYELKLIKMVNEKSLNSVVKFYPFTSERFKFFEFSFVFLLPADIVFCNYTLLESMSQKIPSIVADVEGSDLIIDQNITGIIVQRNKYEIAEAIERIYLNKDMQKQMGEKARQKILRDYNVEKRADRLADIYNQVK